MSAWLTSLRHNLASLSSVEGRDPNRLFWPYAATIMALNYIAGAFLTMPMMSRFGAQLANIFSRARSGQATHEAVKPFDPMLMSDLPNMAIPAALILIATIALLFAAVARRLHDADRTALWGLLPLPFYALGIILMPKAIEGLSDGPNSLPTLYIALTLNSLLSMAALIGLIILLVGKGTVGQNRFGAAPEAVS